LRASRPRNPSAKRRRSADLRRAAVFVVEHCSGECLGVHAARRATRFEALEPIRQAVRHGFGAFGEAVAAGTRLRHDHGSRFVADDFQKEVVFLGLASSPAFVREPEGQGCTERFIRVLEENLLWQRRFDTDEDLRHARHAFEDTYNQHWILQRHGYRTPAQVRAQQTTMAMAA
jgi:transposase InsO family protein